jgi:DNA adenine methylase
MKNIGIGLDSTALEKFSTAHPVELFNVCAHQFLSDYPFTGSELIYCDPPYVRHTRASKNSKYRFEYSDQDHKDLLTLIKTLPCKVILSGYPSALHDDLLGDWHTMELQVMSQSGPRTEKLWYNYTVDRVHWITYAGANFTLRQNIKRKAQNWARRYQALPNAERLAILSALMEVEASDIEATL